MIYDMFVNEIPLKIKIGLTADERQNYQIVLCNIKLKVQHSGNDLDDIAETVNYYDLTLQLQQKAQTCNFKLLEPLAKELTEFTLKIPRVVAVSIELIKPEIMQKLGAKACGVKYELHANH